METEQLFEEIAAFIKESRALLKEGVMMDMQGLDKRVMGLCEKALMMPPEIREQYAIKLQNLMNDLAVLGKDLEAQRDKLAQDIRGVAQHKKAHTAYRVTEASDKPEES